MKLYVARDFGGGLYLFPEKPILRTDYKYWDGDNWFKIDQDLFPEVTFENSPMEVELVIKKKDMADMCGDNRFEIIKKAKAELLKSTNIETSEDEMKVLDNFLFRCWQMGWLDMYDGISEEEFAEQWSKFDINKAYNKIMEEKALKQYEVPTGYIKIQNLPEGYIFKDENGNVINATKIVLEKKEKSAIREEQIDNAAQEYID